MDDKLTQTLQKVILLCDQNPEFASALREKLGMPMPKTEQQASATPTYASSSTNPEVSPLIE